MTHEQRTAMARIISDMIKADNIIEENEIKIMHELMSLYSISQSDMSDSRKIRFSDAVNILKELSAKERKTFVDRMYDIALSDRICVPREALLLLALQYCLVDVNKFDSQGNRISQPYLISCATGEATFNDQYMVYIESEYNNVRNEELKKHFRLLVTISRLSGFNFIYMPKMVEEFQKMDKKYVLDVITYMAPNLEQEFINNVYDSLCQMSTEDFYHSVLRERLQVHVRNDIEPSLLINIGTSVIPYCSAGGSVQYYTEFLCVPIKSDILSLVDDILGFYQSKVSLHQTITLKVGKGQFKYFGFYKALFDFLVAPPPVAPDLIFLGQTKSGKYQVAFKFEDSKMLYLKLSPKEYDVYLSVAKKSCLGRKKGLPVSAENGLKFSISKIKNKITETVPDLTYAEQYKPNREGNAYVLSLKNNKIFIRCYTSYDMNCYQDIPISEYME